MNSELLGITGIYLLTLVLALPLGRYLANVFRGEKNLLDFMAPVERGIFRLSGIDATREMTWQQHMMALLTINLVWFLLAMGIKTVMVTGDNPLTARFIAEKAGVDDYIAEAKPEDKMQYIRAEQQAGKLVAMMGDGTNDALAQADVGVAMNSGTQAAKEAGNMVDLDNDPTKLIEIVEIGKQLLMTRGTLTTFSIANDVAKYFAIVPALFMVGIPALGALNVMGLKSPQPAILSAVIFNALIIPALVPLALKGVPYKVIGASALLRRNLLIYGLSGVVVPFIGIKVIDLIVGVFL